MPAIPQSRFAHWTFLAAVVVYLCTAWCSTGFHAADEQYQVIAFAEARAAHAPRDPLPWEYGAQIRSAFLPVAGMAVFAAARALGMHDPFLLAFLLRALTALLALWALRRFTRGMLPLLPQSLGPPFLLLSYFLWFLPFLLVRFTGETWSGLLILAALAPMPAPQHASRPFLQSGLLLGLAFLCRPPTAAIALGLVGWLVAVKQEARSRTALLLAAMVATVLAGMALDAWFYRQPVATAWNYLRMGVAGNADHPFTEFPWWYYYAWVVKYAIPVFGIPILAAFGLLCAFRPRHFLVWAIVPFLVMHMLLPHKDLRFLYPLAPLMPLLLIAALPAAALHMPRLFGLLARPALRNALLACAAAVNLLALSVVVSSPAGSGRTRLAQHIRQHYPEQPVRINYLSDEPSVWAIRIPRFYLPPNATDSLVGDACGPLQSVHGAAELLVADKQPGPCPMAARQWVPVERALPQWKEIALRAYDLEDVRPVWRLYQSTPAPTPGLPSAP